MTESFILPVGVTGLAKTDFGLVLYANEALVADPGITVSEVSSGHYLLDQIPKGHPANRQLLTYKAGPIIGSRAFPGIWGSPPSTIISPYRQASLTGVSLALYRDNVSQSTAGLSVALTADNDLIVTGIAQNTGRWLLIVVTPLGQFTHEWQGSDPNAAAETVERELLSNLLISNWTSCPVSTPILGFNPESATDVSPFSVDDVRNTLGYVELTLRETDTWDGETTAGMATLDSGGQAIVSTVYTLTRARLTTVVPSVANPTVDEQYRKDLQALFEGIDIRHTGPPDLTLRQLSRWAPRRFNPRDEGTWRKTDLDIQIQRRERRARAGRTEVALP